MPYLPRPVSHRPHCAVCHKKLVCERGGTFWDLNHSGRSTCNQCKVIAEEWNKKTEYIMNILSYIRMEEYRKDFEKLTTSELLNHLVDFKDGVDALRDYRHQNNIW